MPQMYPLNWIMLFIFFILIFIMFNIMNYYIYLKKNKNIFKKLFSTKLNLIWKW
uniref:ATP synthase complex subunit 8 n=1 Tax=Triodia sylvina TaxID=537462 RepID=A0A3T0IB74_9NEOP|nr:ATP synthase F0 subunit 8 [Triodia sylvina]AZU95911.1 ATP synthase F0 subunit 8 [Triodia sylvina]